MNECPVCHGRMLMTVDHSLAFCPNGHVEYAVQAAPVERTPMRADLAARFDAVLAESGAQA